MSFELTSSAFRKNESIPDKHTCDGSDTSVPLEWKDPPAQTRFFALIVDDPDAPRGTFVHWVLYDLSSDTRKLSAGIGHGESLPGGAKQGRNDFGNTGYSGPCPPGGSAHHYHFKLYALDRPTGLPPKATKRQLLDAMKGHVLGQVELVGTYKR